MHFDHGKKKIQISFLAFSIGYVGGPLGDGGV